MLPYSTSNMDYDSWLKRRLKTGINSNNKQLPSDSGCSGSKGSLVNYSLKNKLMDYKQVKNLSKNQIVLNDSFSAFLLKEILNVNLVELYFQLINWAADSWFSISTAAQNTHIVGFCTTTSSRSIISFKRMSKGMKKVHEKEQALEALFDFV